MTRSSADKKMKAVLKFAESCDYEVEHTHQVTGLALQLFDELSSLHGYGEKERLILQYAALLHDVGWVEGQKGHHKTSLRLILAAKDLPFAKRERLIIASVARYHRRAHPKKKHGHFSSLKKADRTLVTVLSAILRVADGLDWSHRSLVEEISCKIKPRKIILMCKVSQSAEGEERAATKKGGLFEEVFGKSMVLEWVES